MALRLTRIHALIGAGALALALPVLAQGPESILPEGFGGPQPAPRTPAPTPTPSPTPTPAALPTGSLTDSAADQLPADSGNAAEAVTEEPGAEFDLPPAARRSVDRVGLLTPKLGGLGDHAFGVRSGDGLARLMAATRAPIASRWASILLRRALISESDTPSGVNGADWVAERAWLLLRMGEADNARLLIQSVDNDRYSKRLYAIAMQSYLASADPAGFCPLLPRARSFSGEPSWFMAQAICASFSADQNSATAILNQAQRRGVARGIDYLLAEKVVGAGPQSRRSVKIEWEGTNRLTTWRFGLATATNVAIPQELYATVGPQVRAWEARAPVLSLAQRLPGTVTATRLGVFSGTAARGFYDAFGEQPEPQAAAQDIAELLRTAFAGEASDARITAMRDFWSRPLIDGGQAGPGGVDYAALPVLARAAASVKPDAVAADDTPWLIAAMLSGGYDRNAARWAGVIDGLSEGVRNRSWALLATGSPEPRVDLSAGRIRDFLSQDESPEKRLGQFLVASLAGLDRLSGADRAALLQGAGIDPTPRTLWQRMIMASAIRGEKGTVALLVATGMQTANWNDVPPRHLYFITTALRRVGLDPYARMIAAEAMARTG